MKLRNLTLGFCLFCGLSAVVVMLRAQAPQGNILPLTGQAPGGAAGGVLAGTYPNPDFAANPSFTGTLFATSDIRTGNVGSLYWNGRAQMLSNADGSIEFTNQARTDFSCLQLGGTTTSYPGVCRSSTSVLFRLADNSADAPIGASNAVLSGFASLGTNPAASGAVRLASAAAINSRNNANSADLILLDTTAADIMRIGGSNVQAIEATVGKINFGCSTSACVQWNRSGTTFQALLADQSARANVQVAQINASTFNGQTNCAVTGASPLACVAAPVGAGSIAVGATSTTVNTTVVTANSVIQITPDSSLGAKLGAITCNTTVATVGTWSVTARVAATSFTVSVSGTVGTNPACFSFSVMN